jgi:hypothetical protein
MKITWYQKYKDKTETCIEMLFSVQVISGFTLPLIIRESPGLQPKTTTFDITVELYAMLI